ncbi:hypothetical protein F4604DRAFT_1935349 [Suillus subluteus]|nr:hypothetical protein F4604DRAFT_1935349 [Suillus subluteus]
MSPEKIPLDLYITPHKLQEVPQQIGGDVAVLVQAFAQEFVIQHLQRFAKRCAIENIKPPQSFPAIHISTNGPQHLPGPLVATGARIVCSAQAPKTFEKNLQTSSVPAADPKKPASAAISEGIQLGPEFGCDAINFSPLLISIGPNTDAALDQFKLRDELLPKLHVLVRTVQSSHWELVLRSQKWDLNYEQASILANALLADLQGVPFSPEIVKHKSSVLSVILKCLGILVNDITQTLKAVKIELKSLQCCTGAESIFYIMRRSTDLPHQSVAFATEGIQDFMPSVMGIDNQDLLGKMEGFVVQGMKGTAQNHQEHVSQAHAAIRNIINSTLHKSLLPFCQITGNPDANMQWALYFWNIVQCYQVIIEGWTDNIPFANLSQVSSALPELDRLFQRWKSGATHWKTLTDEEFEKILQEHNNKLDHGKIDDHR